MNISREHFLKKGLLGIGLFAATRNSQASNERHQASNIFHYGAKGDGKHDDTKALLKAIKQTGSCYIPSHPNPFVISEAEVSSCSIYGEGMISKKKGAVACFITKDKDVLIDGITFLSADSYQNSKSDIKLGDSSSNIRIHNCHFKSSLYSAISADTNGETDKSLTYKAPASHILISNCLIDGQYSRGLYLHNVFEISILNNVLKNTLFDAIRLRQKTGSCLINSNQFFNIGTKKSKDSQDAIDTYWSGQSLTITNNIIKRCSKHALDLKGSSFDESYGTEKIIIANNQISEIDYCGINLSASTNKSTQRAVSKVIINSNLIERCNQQKVSSGNAAILVREKIKNLTITSNLISDNNCRGIFISNLKPNIEENQSIIISSNQCIDNGFKNDGHGILVSSCRFFIIKDNICENTTDQKKQIVGIAIVDDKKRGFKPSKGILTNNVCVNNKKSSIIIPKNSEIMSKDNMEA